MVQEAYCCRLPLLLLARVEDCRAEWGANYPARPSHGVGRRYSRRYAVSRLDWRYRAPLLPCSATKYALGERMKENECTRRGSKDGLQGKTMPDTN